MQMARDIAGFSMSEADELRKVMGKKQKEKIPLYQEKFVAGAAATSAIDRPLAERAIPLHRTVRGLRLQQVARGGVRADRLSDRLPQGEPSAAILRGADDFGQRQDRQARRVHRRGEEGRHRRVAARRQRIAGRFRRRRRTRFASGWPRSRASAKERCGGIIETRETDGRFVDLFDLAERVDAKQVNRRVFEALVKCGALDGVPGNRAQKLAALDTALELAARTTRDAELGQGSLFGEAHEQAPTLAPKLPDVAAPTTREMLGVGARDARDLRFRTSARRDRAAARARRSDADQRSAASSKTTPR